MSSGTSSEALDAFTDQGSEFDRWQSIEEEVWGDGESLHKPQTKKEKREQKKSRNGAAKGEDRSGGPLLVVFFFGLGFFALLYWLLLAPGSDAAASDAGAKEAVPAALARVVDQPACAEVQALATNNRFVAVEADIADVLAAGQRDLDQLTRLRAADSDTAQLAAPLEFRAQLVATLAIKVQAGELTPADLRNQIAPLDPQIEGVQRAMQTFSQQNC